MINEFPNPSLEAGVSGWGFEADFTRSNSDAHSGEYSIAQSSVSEFANCVFGNDGVDLKVKANTLYILSFWVKLISHTGFGVNVDINAISPYEGHVTDGSPALNGVGDSLATSGEWEKLSIPFNSGANTKLYLRMYNCNGAMVAYYDDFKLIEQIHLTAQSPEQVFAELAGYSSIESLQIMLARYLSKTPLTGDSDQGALNTANGLPRTQESIQKIFFDNLRESLSLDGIYAQHSIQSMLIKARNAGLSLSSVVGV